MQGTRDPKGEEDARVSGKKRSMTKAVLKVVAILAAVVVVDVALSFALEPYASHSDVIWQDYRSRSDEPIDTLLLGSSSVEEGLNPDIIDQEAGTYSFNLATPGSNINNCRYTLEDVLDDHDIKKVVVGITYSTMTAKHEINADVATAQAKMQGASLTDDLKYAGEVLGDRQNLLGIKSLVALAPWSVLHVDYDPALIRANIERRGFMTPVEAAYPSPWVYVGRGFCGVSGEGPGFNNADDSEKYERSLDFDDENVQDLLSICRTCKERGIDLIVCVPPRATYRTLMYGDRYPQGMSYVQQQVEALGAKYVDFNLARPSLFNPVESDFHDEYHLTLDGANEFSGFAGKVFADMWAGKDVSDEFFTYDGWNDYLQSLDANDFSPAFYTSTVRDGAIDIHPWSLTGPNVTTEYRVEVKEAGQTDFTLLEDWTTDADCTYQTSGHGEVTIRVMSRPQGVDNPAEHICDKVIAY